MAANDVLSRWELKILGSIEKQVKSEKKIAKDISLNELTTSQLITGLMTKGYIGRILNKGTIRRYSYREKFAITQEGLAILEEFNRQNSPWNQLRDLLRQESSEFPLKITIGAVMIGYRLAKFVLKP